MEIKDASIRAAGRKIDDNFLFLTKF
ncbi:uncharacterized protein METZ01_LOCUS321650 [marine metagenome]|uniref:Uncharacterized protein n=1 Tax=marine metagenome TaxID=408172 RepID=A0A382P663_9ZZZZ